MHMPFYKSYYISSIMELKIVILFSGAGYPSAPNFPVINPLKTISIVFQHTQLVLD